MVPGSLAIIAKAYPASERGKAIGIWAAASAVTTSAGPIVGGLILTLLDDWAWRLIFFINLPLAALALGMLWLRVPADAPSEKRGLDLVGAGLATLALFLIAFGMTGSGEEGSVPETGRLFGLTGAGVAMMLVFVFWESRARAPMVPLRLFSNLGFSGANILTFFLYFALSAVLFYLPMTAISAWGVSEAELSVAFLPIGVALTLLSGPSGALADRIGPAPLVTGGAVLVAIAYAGLAFTAPLEAFWTAVMPFLVVMGIGMGLVVSPLSTAVMTSVSDEDTGTASGVNNALSRMAVLVAVAAMGGVAAFAFQSALAGGPGEGLGLSFGLAPDGGLDEAAQASWHDATNSAFAMVAYINAGLAALAAIVAWFTLAHKWREKKVSS